MDKLEGLFYWLPRSLSIIAIIIVTAFSFDVFQSGESVAGQLEDLVIHLVPSYLLTVILVVAWKWEYTGGIIFLVIGLVSSPYVFYGNYSNNHSVTSSLITILLVTVPFIIIGALFLVSYYKRKKSIQTA